MKIEVKVVPNSRAEGVVEGSPLIVRVKEPPKKGMANKAVLKLLSKHFNARVKIVSGAKRKKKIVEIEKV
jgi:uncharacterized protein (TIGR00251 family)